MDSINGFNKIIYQQNWKKQQQTIQSITATTPNNKDKEKGNNYDKEKEKSKRKINNNGRSPRVR